MFIRKSETNVTSNVGNRTVGHVPRDVAGIFTQLWGSGQCEWCPLNQIFGGRVPSPVLNGLTPMGRPKLD